MIYKQGATEYSLPLNYSGLLEIKNKYSNNVDVLQPPLYSIILVFGLSIHTMHGSRGGFEIVTIEGLLLVLQSNPLMGLNMASLRLHY